VGRPQVINTNICVRGGFIKDLDDQGAGLLTQWRVRIGGFTPIFHKIPSLFNQYQIKAPVEYKVWIKFLLK